MLLVECVMCFGGPRAALAKDCSDVLQVHVHKREVGGARLAGNMEADALLDACHRGDFLDNPIGR